MDNTQQQQHSTYVDKNNVVTFRRPECQHQIHADTCVLSTERVSTRLVMFRKARGEVNAKGINVCESEKHQRW